MKESDIPKTDFVCLQGLYEFVCILYEFVRILYEFVRILYEFVRILYEFVCILYEFVRLLYEFVIIKEHPTPEFFLEYPQTDHPYKLCMDASDYASGSILVQ